MIYFLTQNIDGIAIFGTTGEATSFSIEEKLDAIHFLVDNKIDPHKLIPGTGLNSIKDTVYFKKVVSKLKVKKSVNGELYNRLSLYSIKNYKDSQLILMK